MLKINSALLEDLTRQAKLSTRKRKNLNFHKSDSDTLQRMMNAMEPGTYVHPHKHVNPDKREVFILLKGRIAVVEFDDAGSISDKIILDHKTENYAAEIVVKSWHTVISLEQGSVYYEVKDGPYEQETDKVFAPWAPEEDSLEVTGYLDHLVKKLF